MNSHLQKIKSFGFDPKVTLDIGAYVGNWSRMIKSIFPSTRIHAFEAQPALEPHMVKLKNDYGGTVDYTISLIGSENKKNVPFFNLVTADGSTGSSIYSENTKYQKTVSNLDMQTVDSILTEKRIGETVDLIKIDVQGAEIDVLKGATKALSTAKVVICELSLVEYNKGAPLISDVMTFMAERGFVLYDIVEFHKANRDTLIQIDGMFVLKDSPWREPSFWNK